MQQTAAGPKRDLISAMYGGAAEQQPLVSGGLFGSGAIKDDDGDGSDDDFLNSLTNKPGEKPALPDILDTRQSQA